MLHVLTIKPAIYNFHFLFSYLKDEVLVLISVPHTLYVSLPYPQTIHHPPLTRRFPYWQ